MDVTNVGF